MTRRKLSTHFHHHVYQNKSNNLLGEVLKVLCSVGVYYTRYKCILCIVYRRVSLNTYVLYTDLSHTTRLLFPQDTTHFQTGFIHVDLVNKYKIILSV